MPNYANIDLIGHAGATPELRKTNSGESVCRFGLAVKNRKDETTWYEVSVFGKQAENYVSRYLKKGNAVFVTGEPSLDKYTNKEGKEVTQVKVLANKVQILERSEEQQQPAQKSKAQPVDDLENEVPF